MGTKLGAGLAGIAMTLNPELIVIGGGVTRRGAAARAGPRGAAGGPWRRHGRPRVVAAAGGGGGHDRRRAAARGGTLTGRLVVCPTPIGNLEDVTLRVLSALRDADVIACEDTRRTRVLLDRYGVQATLVSYHEHNEAARTASWSARMERGEVVALVSDAGMPLVCDPGYVLVQGCVAAGLEVEVLPGPSAVMAALVASALPSDVWRFVGFLPRKGPRSPRCWRRRRRSWPSSRPTASRRRWPRSSRSARWRSAGS